MKRIISVWMAAARTLLWKLLLIVILMAGVQTILFWRQILDANIHQYAAGFGALVQWSHLHETFGLAFAILCVLLCLQGSQLSGSKMDYTLQRLPMGEERVTLLWALLHIGCLIILWACQLAVIFGFWILYNRYAFCASSNGLELFVSFYDSSILHSLLPLADITRHVRNILWILSLGFHTSAFGYFQRRDKFLVKTVFLLSVGVGLFSTAMGSPWIDIFLSLLYLSSTGLTLCQMRRMRYEAD